MRHPGHLALLLLLAPAVAAAQDTISTDRPGLGFSAATVPTGAFQVELGLPAVAWSSGGGTSVRTIDFPALARLGLTRGIELRLGSPLLGVEHATSAGRGATTTGFGGVEVGLKVALPAAGSRPALALVPSVVVPIGDPRFAGERATYNLNGVAAWGLPAGLGLTTVAGISRVPADGSDYDTRGSLVAALGRALVPGLGGYVEAGLFPGPGPDPAYAGAGLTRLLSRSVQVDAFVDRGLGGGAADWLFGAGLSARWGGRRP